MKNILSRALLACISLFGVITLCFLLLHIVPGDPVDLMLGDRADISDKNNLRRELGLDQPMWTQYGQYLVRLSQLDMGQSLASRNSVLSEIVYYFPATLELASTGLLWAILWGLPLGVWSAVRRGSWLDRACGGIAVLGMSLPGVFLGPMLIFLFAIYWDIFPVSDRQSFENLVLPALSLSIPLGAVILRMTRASMFEVLSQDYMRTAKAKGLSKRQIYFSHGLRNALIPIVTILGLQLGALMTGTVITETIFDWPGLGTLLLNALQKRDYPMVQGCVLFIGCIYVFVNSATDVVYGLVDPRSKKGSA